MANKKKINLLGCILMGIGCIVGAGIFGTLPEVASTVGPGIVWALIGAAAVVILRSISRMYTCAALPTSASSFMYASKLIHPNVSVMLSITAFLQPTMVAMFGILFASYFKELFPGLGLSDSAVGVILLLIFGVIAWFGNKTSVTISNIIVVVLLVAIAIYIFLGMSDVSADNVTFGSVVKSGASISGIAAAIGVLTSSLSGASSCAEIMDDIEKPERNVPLALILCPVIVAIVYILMAVVTIGVIPYAEVKTLSQVANEFMSPMLLKFFIIGGPIAGVITSLVPVALACVALFEYSAKQKFYPAVLAKQNKHGVPILSLILTVGIAIGICATGATFGVIMTIFSFTNTVFELPNTLSPIFAYRKYPKTCANSSVHMPKPLISVLAVITFCICIYLCVQMALTLNVIAVIGIISVYVIGYIYYFIRIKYLKSKNVDLIAEMKKPHEVWEAKENSFQ